MPARARRIASGFPEVDGRIADGQQRSPVRGYRCLQAIHELRAVGAVVEMRRAAETRVPSPRARDRAAHPKRPAPFARWPTRDSPSRPAPASSLPGRCLRGRRPRCRAGTYTCRSVLATFAAALTRYIVHCVSRPDCDGIRRRDDAEIVGDFELRSPDSTASDRQPDRHDEPVVAEGQRELRHAHAQQFGDARLRAGEIDASVFELPVAIGRHAGIANRRRVRDSTANVCSVRSVPCDSASR